MGERNKELLVALGIYVVTITVLLMAIYRFLENWELKDFNFFVAGALVLLVALGWGYVLTSVIFAPKKKMEDTLTSLSHDIIHELNIPLSTITANVRLLQKTLEDEKSLKRLGRIEDASKRLARLYDELVYSIKKEIHEIPKEYFDVKKLIEERVSFFQEQGRNPFNIVLEEYKIKADKIGFEQMIDNLLTNAMKYSDKKSLIKISLNENILRIEDEGIGMSTSELLRMHERYFQGDDTQEGQGIGLALVKTYCEQENIEIQITSEKKVGTKICLTLN